MKRHLRISLLVVLGLAGIAAAAAYTGTIENIFSTPVFLKAGFFVGASSTADTRNRVTRMPTGARAYDFPAIGNGALEYACLQSYAITTTGAQLGEVCLAATDLGMDAGSHLPDNVYLSCDVTAANETKVRMCAQFTDAGTYNAGDAGYFTRVISNRL